MFFAEHFIFILFPEINFFSLLQNMCLRRFKQGEEIYHHPSSAFGFATAFLTGAAAFVGVDFVAPVLAP